VLVHSKLTQFHMPCGSRARFSGVIRQVALLREEFRIPKLTFHSELRRGAASRLALPCTSSLYQLQFRLILMYIWCVNGATL